VPIVGGVIAVDRIVLAAPGELQAVEIAHGFIPGQEIVAAVLLQADAYAKSGYNVAIAVVLGQVVCDIIVVGAVCHQDAVLVLVRGVCRNLAMGAIPEGEAEGVLGDAVIG